MNPTPNTTSKPTEQTEDDRRLARNRWLLLLLLFLLLFGIGLYAQKDGAQSYAVPPTPSVAQISKKPAFNPSISDADIPDYQKIKIILAPPTLPIKVQSTFYQCRKSLCMYRIDLLNKSPNEIKVDGTLYALKRPTHIVGDKELPIIMGANEARKFTGALTVVEQPEGIMLYIEEL